MQKKENSKKKYVIISTVLIVLIVTCVLTLVKCTDFFNKDEEKTDSYINLGEGIKISSIGSYNGMFVEDGSNEKLEDILSIVVVNTNENDLQYAEIYLKYENYTAEFTVSNLPSGESAMLFEKKRAKSREEKPDIYLMENSVFFQTKMDAKNDIIEISGVNGVANIKNISDKDIVGEIVIDYKNYSNNMFYGGITYRITVSGGLKAGEIKQTNAGHFSPSNSRIMSVNIIEK